MIDTPPVSRPKLAAVPCAICGHPVSHTDPRVPGALAGGMCMRSTCVKDPKTSKPRQVFTFVRLVEDDS